jgi:hypothetical protein
MPKEGHPVGWFCYQYILAGDDGDVASVGVGVAEA